MTIKKHLGGEDGSHQTLFDCCGKNTIVKHEATLHCAEKERAKAEARNEMVATGRHNHLIISDTDENEGENPEQVVHELATKLDKFKSFLG